MTPIQRFATPEPTLCAVCQRHAWGLAYARTDRGPFIWLCTNKDCHQAAKEVYKMPEEKLDAYEHAASMKAGEDAGAFLDSIKKTDLTTLSASEWQELCHVFTHGYTTELRRKILSGEPPF